MRTVLIVLAVLWVLWRLRPYWLHVLLGRAFSNPLEPKLRATSVEWVRPPARGYIEACTEQLGALGYARTGCVGFAFEEGDEAGEATPRGFQAFFVHRDGQVGAEVAVFNENQVVDASLESQVGYVPDRAWCELFSELADGRHIFTVNQRSPGTFAPTPQRLMLRIPEVKDLAHLDRVHRERLRTSGGAPRTLELADVLEVARTRYAWDMDQQERAGAFVRERRGTETVYRTTWRGAAGMTWRLLWPWLQIAERSREREVRTLLGTVPREESRDAPLASG